MTTPDIPQQTPAEFPKEALQNLRSEVQLPKEAIPARDRTVDVLANARDERLALIASMKQERNVPKADSQKLETVLTA